MKKCCYLWVCLLIVFVASYLPAAAQSKPKGLQSGIWRGVLQRTDGQQLSFNFRVATGKGKTVLYVLNADEKLLVDSVLIKKDSVIIQMPFFDSYLAARIQNNGNLTGSFIKNFGDHIMQIPFTAQHGIAIRYPITQKPKYNTTGKWAVSFDNKDPVSHGAIGEFVQDAKGKVKGTLRTPTGDYRYLEGVVSGDSLYLSTFDGGEGVVLIANLQNDSTISHAMMYSGDTETEGWSAVKNDTATLPDSYSITKLRPGENVLTFRFPSTDGKMISLQDERYKNKVVILQILGSWCPNCMDETAFLSDYYNQNKDKGVEVIGIAYERTESMADAIRNLQPFRKRFAVQYPFLLTGVSIDDNRRTEKTLPQLESIRAFPTTIFINKKGMVDKIHTGFDGPATGSHYEDYKKEFKEDVDRLLNEKE